LRRGFTKSISGGRVCLAQSQRDGFKCVNSLESLVLVVIAQCLPKYVNPLVPSKAIKIVFTHCFTSDLFYISLLREQNINIYLNSARNTLLSYLKSLKRDIGQQPMYPD
jgi:hypothetical protein